MNGHKTWIALVEVVPKIGSTFLDKAPGAWVNVVANVRDEDEYKSALWGSLEYYGLELRALEDLEPIDIRLRRTTIDKDILELASQLSEPGALRFGTFHTYDDEGPSIS